MKLQQLKNKLSQKYYRENYNNLCWRRKQNIDIIIDDMRKNEK